MLQLDATAFFNDFGSDRVGFAAVDPAAVGSTSGDSTAVGYFAVGAAVGSTASGSVAFSYVEICTALQLSMLQLAATAVFNAFGSAAVGTATVGST